MENKNKDTLSTSAFIGFILLILSISFFTSLAVGEYYKSEFNKFKNNCLATTINRKSNLSEDGYATNFIFLDLTVETLQDAQRDILVLNEQRVMANREINKLKQFSSCMIGN